MALPSRNFQKTGMSFAKFCKVWRCREPRCWPAPGDAAIHLHSQPMNLPMTQTLAPDGPVVALMRARFPLAIAIYAFGSQVQGTAGAASDLDLALLVAGYAEPLALWDTASVLAELAACPVDLLDLRAASTVMQYQVISSGQRLWAAGVAADLFECFVLSEKTALDSARAPLLADIALRGEIYGR